MRDNASLTRPAYIEADLRRIFEADGFADFAALWLLIHASRFGAPGAPITDCALERWREAGGKEGIAARDRLREGVEAALLVLGQGFLAENARAARARGEGRTPAHRLFRPAAAPGLSPDLSCSRRGARPASRTRRARRPRAGCMRRAIRSPPCARRPSAAPPGIGISTNGRACNVVFLALARGEKRLGLPALGGLFLPELTRDLDAARLPNRALMEAIYQLAWLKDEAALTPDQLARHGDRGTGLGL